MAKIVLIGVEQVADKQICFVLAGGSHQIEHRPRDLDIRELLDADIVFAGYEQTCSLLRRVREAWPGLPFIVVTRVLETKDWLDALEAGATDYCSTPIEARQPHWLMESALLPPRASA